jgi:hypothetical protein
LRQDRQKKALPSPRARRRKPQDRRRLSEVLEELAGSEAMRITIRQLRDALGGRSYGAILFLLALLNLLPLPPGGGIVLALMVILVSAQLVWGRATPAFPRLLTGRFFAPSDFRRVLARLLPFIRAAERVMKPRLLGLQGPLAARLTGFVCLALGLVLLIPTPFGGNWPPALAIAILALALVARDGLVTLLGLVLSAASMFLMWTILSRLGHMLLSGPG